MQLNSSAPLGVADVADLEGERRLAGEAHREEREAVAGHLVGGESAVTCSRFFGPVGTGIFHL